MANAVLCSSWKHQARLTSSNESHGCSVANVIIKIKFKFIPLINLKYISNKRKEWIFTFCHAFSEHNSKIKVELAIHRSLTRCPVLFSSLPTLIMINVQWLAAVAAFRWRPDGICDARLLLSPKFPLRCRTEIRTPDALTAGTHSFVLFFWRVRNFLVFWKM